MSGILQTFLGKSSGGVSPITGLIAYWKFANGADTTEYTGTYNLTKTGTPTIGTDRLGNTAGFSAFSTTNYFSHPTFLDAGLTAWTCFFWFKKTGTTFTWIMGKTGNTPYPIEIYCEANNKIRYQLGPSYPPNIIESTVAINDGNWHFAVLSGNNTGRSSLKMDIDGTSVGSLIQTGSDSGAIVANTDYDYTFGTRYPGSLSAFSGSIGECGFCNRVLTASEKLRLYTESASQYIVPNILIP